MRIHALTAYTAAEAAAAAVIALYTIEQKLRNYPTRSISKHTTS